MKFKGSMLTTIGAVALTLGAATAALAVNAGILRSAPDSGVGNLETEATVPVTSDDPNVRYVTVFVDEPAPVESTPVTTTAPVPAGAVADPLPGSSSTSEFEGDHETEYEDHGTEADDQHESEYEDHEYEGADDDD